jgi:phage baseplate assembly protein W
MAENIAYRRDIPFDFELDDRGDLKMKEDDDAIAQSLYTIIRTNFGDKVGYLNFGTNLESDVFEQAVPLEFLSMVIESKILTSISSFEPDVSINSVHVSWKDEAQNSIIIKVEYTVSTDLERKLFSEEISVLNKDSITIEGYSNG